MFESTDLALVAQPIAFLFDRYEPGARRRRTAIAMFVVLRLAEQSAAPLSIFKAMAEI